jgi:hypothetical protein
MNETRGSLAVNRLVEKVAMRSLAFTEDRAKMSISSVDSWESALFQVELSVIAFGHDPACWILPILEFEFVSDFEFRISQFGTGASNPSISL